MFGAEKESLPLQTVACSYGFEEPGPGFQHWLTCPATHTVHFVGITDEKACSGRKSFKLDVSFQDASYSYWSLPVNFPAEGTLRLKGRLLITSGAGAGVGLGYNVLYPPSYLSGCQAFVTLPPSPAWQTIEGEVATTPAVMPRGVAAHIKGLQMTGHCGAVMDKIGLFIYAAAGSRVTVYIDDIELAGTVPDSQAYKEECARRWALYTNGPFARMMEQFKEDADQIAFLAENEPEHFSSVWEKLDIVAAKCADIRKRGWLYPKEYEEIMELLTDARETVFAGLLNCDLFKK